MVRKDKPRTRATFSSNDMSAAIQDVLSGKSLRTAAADHGVKYQTLQRYVVKKRRDPDYDRTEPNYDVRRIFTDEQENSLTDYIKICSKMSYGLTTIQTRKVAYDMAARNNIVVPETWTKNKLAGIQWFRSFLKRRGNLSIRQPEGCSLSRLTSFNPHNVKMFFDNLQEVYSRYPPAVADCRIYNLDETSTTTVQKPKKVVAEKGVKQLNSCTSGERGVLVTTCVIICANGTFLPPVMVFPRKYYKEHMTQGAPPGTLGLANPSGWMNGELFIDVIKHFIKFSNSSIKNPAILIYDNHESHITYDVVEMAKAHGVIIVTLPPHCSNKLQPLDVAVFGPFKAYYNAAIENWLVNNPGKPLTIYKIAQCVGEAHIKAVSAKNIMSGFKKTGIFPLDRDVFSDADFIACAVTDRPQEHEESAVQTNEATPFTQEHESALQTNEAGPSIQTLSPPKTPEKQKISKNLEIPTVSRTPFAEIQSKNSVPFISPHQFRGFPKAEKRKTEGRRNKRKSSILTNTPDLDALKHEMENKKKPTKQERKKVKRDLASECKVIKPAPKPKKAKYASDLSEESAFEEIIYDDSSGDECEIFQLEDNAGLDPDTEIITGGFVMIKFDNKIFYIAKVLKALENNEFEVSFLRKSGKLQGSFIFPIVEDVAPVGRSDIVLLLPEPTNVNRNNRRLASYYQFGIKFDGIDLR